LNALFADQVVYYEFGNERDGTWFGPAVSAVEYAAAWDRVLPVLQAQANNARFVGPVTYHADPVYISTFLQRVQVRPDAVSWHEYTCPSTASDHSCLESLERWPQHVTATRERIHAAIGTPLPLIISEWNWNPLNTPDTRIQNYDFIYRWTYRAFEIMAEQKIFASCQYCLTNNSGLAMLNDQTHALTGQAAAFRDSYEAFGGQGS
jgi:hypothetical protein